MNYRKRSDINEQRKSEKYDNQLGYWDKKTTLLKLL